MQYFGLRKEQVPLIVIQTTDGQKYLKANLEPDHIAPWVQDYKVMCEEEDFVAYFSFKCVHL